jgi:CRISPR-associated protein Cmr5
MKIVNKWLSIADAALSTAHIVNNDGKVKEVFKGYVSSFGAMVIQNGLPAALAINMKSDTEEGKQKKKIIEAIAEILKNSSISVYNNMDANTLLNESCIQANDTNPRSIRLLKEDVINASIALKLMMRTYEFFE